MHRDGIYHGRVSTVETHSTVGVFGLPLQTTVEVLRPEPNLSSQFKRKGSLYLLRTEPSSRLSGHEGGD